METLVLKVELESSGSSGRQNEDKLSVGSPKGLFERDD